ncbi:MAG: UDP-N-acetylmuramate dehydrogenase [Sphingobacteriales bacterium]|nr:UDP-N-acetylmuramate dehydrogenase [Sphingobacteriales bacterium]
MGLQQNISLKAYNTFGIEAIAREFGTFSSSDDLASLVENHQPGDILILGGGSNILLTKNYDGLALKNEIKGIKVVYEDAHHIDVKVGAGENWHQFVLHCLKHNWAGVENLSLIPGNVGASPMQNIGAYGVEIKNVFYCLEAYSYADKKVFNFTVNDCEFGYRESVFKKKYKNQFVILNVTYRLNKQPKFTTSYGAIEEELNKMGVKELSIQSISQAVINIRTSKLPDPKLIGNAGSFFKNPSVPKEVYELLQSKFSSIVGYTNADGSVKLAAGWLIEQCGWKGFRKGDAGCYEKQALVLVNYGNAAGADIYQLSTEIIQSVKAKFGVELEREVNII